MISNRCLFVTIFHVILLFLLISLFDFGFVFVHGRHFFVWFLPFSPEFSYRTGLGAVPEGASSGASPSATGSGGAPNRPLPPTPDDDESQGDKTLVLRRVRVIQTHITVITFKIAVVEAVKSYIRLFLLEYGKNDALSLPI